MFKIVKALHVTATERKIIKWMLENNEISAGTKRIHIEMDSLTEKVRNLVVYADGRKSKVIIEVL
jgi:hypothetical protein